MSPPVTLIMGGMENAITTRMTGASPAWQAKVASVAAELERHESIPIEVEQHLHAGVYTRTGCQKAGTVVTTALIKVPTQLIISGHCRIYCERDVFDVRGFKVLEGLAGRQMIVYAYEDTWMTCAFATEAPSVEEAEAEAVGEWVGRLSNHAFLEQS